jgi:ATP-dependent helicase HrpA
MPAPVIRRALSRTEAERRDAIHRSLLTGLLSNVGKKAEAGEKKNAEGGGGGGGGGGGKTGDYLGPRSIKFNIFPGSALFKARPPWLMAAEVVETARLYARTVAPLNPEWIEFIAPHLLSASYGDPYWDRRSMRALVKQRLTYHGLVVVPARPVPFAKVDETGARNLFIQHALVEADIDRHPRFLRHNLDLMQDIKRLEDKARRRDLLADVARQFSFYDVRLPHDITDWHRFERWLRKAERGNPKLMYMSREDILAGDAADITEAKYPDLFEVPGTAIKLELRYRYEPGHPADGVTAHVPLEALPALSAWQFDRLVPGYLEAKVDALIRSLPKTLRTKYVPVPQYTEAALPHVREPQGLLTEVLAKHLGVSPADFDLKEIPVHLQFNFRVMDAANKLIAAGRDLSLLRKELGVKARSVFAELPPSEWNRDNLTRWDFDELPRKVDVQIGHSVMPAYPAIVDMGETVSLRLMEAPEVAYQATRGGLRRMFALQLAEEMKFLETHLPGFDKMALYYRAMTAGQGTASDLKSDILAAASEHALVTEPEEIRTKQQFIDHAKEGWRNLMPAAQDIAKIAQEVLESRHRIDQQINGTNTDGTPRIWPELLLPSVRDVQEQVVNLMPKRFLTLTPQQWLPHLPRFMKAAETRLGKLLNAGAGRDIENLKVIRPLWKRYVDRAKAHLEQNIRDPELLTYRWMLEELRVSLFAQGQRTSIPISPQRLEKQWEKVRPAK